MNRIPDEDCGVMREDVHFGSNIQFLYWSQEIQRFYFAFVVKNDKDTGDFFLLEIKKCDFISPDFSLSILACIRYIR